MITTRREQGSPILCQMEERHGQQTIEYVRPGSLSAFNLSRLPRRQRKRRISSRDVRPDSKVSPRSSVSSRRSSDRNIDKPYFDVHIDWTDLKEAHAKDLKESSRSTQGAEQGIPDEYPWRAKMVPRNLCAIRL